jgi:hypothetical protein
MKKHTKVFWTTQERDQIYAQLKGLFLTNKNINDTDALEMAQRILPSYRRRPNKYKLAWVMRSVINQARLDAEVKGNSKPEQQAVTESSVLFDLMVEAVAEKIAARVKELLK